MVKPSAELSAVFLRFLRAVQERDESAVRGLMSPGEHTLIVGSDPREWFRGAESVELILVQVRAMPSFEYQPKRIESFEHDRVGWVSADVTSHVVGGSDIDLRMSAVFVLEGPGWRLTHLHTAAPRPDDPEHIGRELSATMRGILDSLDADAEGRALRQRLRTRTLTFLFTDIEGSTRRTEERGDFDWARVVEGHFAQIREIAEANDGVLVKTMGDGAMLAFGAAEEAVRSAIEIMRVALPEAGEDPIRIRAGVHTGEAVRNEDDYFGQTVNRTARIAAAARPGQILVSEVVKALVADQTDIPLGPGLVFELKGISGAQTLYPVLTFG
jgi:class 3 adenylate cyclase